MARLNTSQSFVHNVGQGKLEPTNHLRNDILNKSEINYLTLLESEVELMIKYIDASNIDSEKSLRKTLETSTRSISSTGDPGGLIATKVIDVDQKYSTLKKYIDLLNKAVGDGEKYELGHETGVFTRMLQVIYEKWKPKDIYSTERRMLLEKAIKASLVVDTVNEKLYKDLLSKGKVTVKGLSKKDLEQVLKSAGSALELNLTLDKEVAPLISNISGKGRTVLKVGLRAELSSLNQFTGGLANSLQAVVKKITTSNKVEDFREIENLLSNIDIFNMRGSPSSVDIVKDGIIQELGFQKKSKIKKQAKTLRLHRRIPATNTQNKALKKKIKRRISLLQTKIAAVEKKKKFIIPTVTLKAILNESLPAYIEQRMELPNAPVSKAYLRYQTGRFAESARVLTLNRLETGAYMGTYGYLTNPYKIYENSVGRNPKNYIETAIRDIAKITLGNNFRGIFMETK